MTELGAFHPPEQPKLAECRRCNCSLAGGASTTLLYLFRAHHEGHDQDLDDPLQTPAVNPETTSSPAIPTSSENQSTLSSGTGSTGSPSLRGNQSRTGRTAHPRNTPHDPTSSRNQSPQETNL